MFLKRKLRKQKNYSFTNPLPLQEYAIKSTLTDYFGATVFLFVVLVIMLLAELWEDRSLAPPIYYLIIFIILVGMFIFCLTNAIRCFSIFRKINKIKFASEQVVSIKCHRVSFIIKSKSKYSSAIACIILIDEKGDTFTYVYPEDKEPSDFAKKSIKEGYLGRNMELICYKNTNIIKKNLGN